MKLLRFSTGNRAEKETAAWGVLEGETVVEIESPGEDWCDRRFNETGRRFNLAGVSLLAPCTPSKVICLGLNYRTHAEEMGVPLPDSPILFMKPSTSVIGPGDAIKLPPQSSRVDYEAELGVVVGRKARNVSREQALDYVFGYTCANDVTARDLQPPAGQWTYAKGFDTFCPLGPWIETDIADPENLSLEGVLNGKTVQSTSTTDHIFPVAYLLSYISGAMTLLPGDVIITGTPAGIGPLQPGDSFSVTVNGIGTLTNGCS